MPPVGDGATWLIENVDSVADSYPDAAGVGAHVAINPLTGHPAVIHVAHLRTLGYNELRYLEWNGSS